MKVICRKRYSTVNNFINGKEYECFHEVDKEYTGMKWIKDEFGHWKCIDPRAKKCPHLISVGPTLDCWGKPIQHSVGYWEISDNSDSKIIYNIP
jgi:hypothetical protein